MSCTCNHHLSIICDLYCGIYDCNYCLHLYYYSSSKDNKINCFNLICEENKINLFKFFINNNFNINLGNGWELACWYGSNDIIKEFLSNDKFIIKFDKQLFFNIILSNLNPHWISTINILFNDYRIRQLFIIYDIQQLWHLFFHSSNLWYNYKKNYIKIKVYNHDHDNDIHSWCLLLNSLSNFYPEDEPFILQFKRLPENQLLENFKLE